MSLLRLQIKAPNRTVWRVSEPLKARNLGKAVRIVDRIDPACRRTAAVNQEATRTSVAEVVSDLDDICHRAPVPCA